MRKFNFFLFRHPILLLLPPHNHNHTHHNNHHHHQLQVQQIQPLLPHLHPPPHLQEQEVRHPPHPPLLHYLPQEQLLQHLLLRHLLLLHFHLPPPPLQSQGQQPQPPLHSQALPHLPPPPPPLLKLQHFHLLIHPLLLHFPLHHFPLLH